MPYGTVKIDKIIYTRNGVDNLIFVSGLAESTTGDLTLTGTAAGLTARFANGIFSQSVSGAAVTGNILLGTSITGVSGIFTSLISGNVITGNTAGFTTITGATVTGNTGRFATLTSDAATVTTVTGTNAQFSGTISGATITGTAAQFGTITGNTAGFTTVTGTTITGTNAQFGGIVSGAVVTGGTAGFTAVTGSTVTGTSGNFVSGVFSKGIGIGLPNTATFTGVNSFLDVSGIYIQTVSTVAASNIDCSSGNYFTRTTTGGANTFSVTNVPASGRVYSFLLELTVAASTTTITWFSGVVWPNDLVPSFTTSRTHLVSFITDDGGARWRGNAIINYTT